MDISTKTCVIFYTQANHGMGHVIIKNFTFLRSVVMSRHPNRMTMSQFDVDGLHSRVLGLCLVEFPSMNNNDGSNRDNMTDHKLGTREEWLAARLELLKAEKELTRRSDELAQWRRKLPWVRIDKEYRFETDEGMASLADLFRGRSQLLTYHFMFGPEYTGGCPACSANADGFNGFAVHLENHDVAMIAVSRAPMTELQAYRRRMGWTFTWV